MGAIFSKFKEKTSTKEVLQNIEDEIMSLEDYKVTTQEWQKKVLRRLVIYSILIYLIACLLAFFFPVASYKLYFYSGFLLFPLFIQGIRKSLTWHYRRSIKKNDKRLEDLQVKKQQILEQIMETETYKVAREILEQFAPEQLGKHTPLKDVKNTTIKPGTPGTDVRRRNTVSDLPPPATPAPRRVQVIQSTPLPKTVGRPLVPPQTPARPMPDLQYRTPMPQFQAQPPQRQLEPDQGRNRPSGPPMARPIGPRERGYVHQIIDYLVGDGPSNRYALICRQCESHNGMALKEEFEFLSFRCCYCYYWNPAKKHRPVAPRLSGQLGPPLQSRSYPDVTSQTVASPPLSNEEEDETDSNSEDMHELSSSEEEVEERAESAKPPPDVTLPSQVAQTNGKTPEKDTNDVSCMDVE